MKRLDHSRPSLVEFLGSIKFSRGQGSSPLDDESYQQFARLQPLTRSKHPAEDAQLIRSAN